VPTHDFKNVGDVLDFEILKGIITAIDSATDTCTVTVAGSSYNALIFYHCKPDSIARENGAIEGAAAGFAENDEVVVMIKNDNSSVKVIGHTDGVRHCSGFVVFTLSMVRLLSDPPEQLFDKQVVVVWDVEKNLPLEWEGGIVISPTDEDFVLWTNGKVNRALPLISDEQVEDYLNYVNRPDLVDTGLMQYHCMSGGIVGMANFGPESTFCAVLPPRSPVEITGYRTEKEILPLAGTVRFHWRVQKKEFSDWQPPGNTGWYHSCITTYQDFVTDNADAEGGGYGPPPEVVQHPLYHESGRNPPDPYFYYEFPWDMGQTWDSYQPNNYTFVGLSNTPIGFATYAKGYFDCSGAIGAYTAHGFYKVKDIPWHLPVTVRRPEWTDDEFEFFKKRWYYRNTVGKYTSNVIANATILQFAVHEKGWEIDRSLPSPYRKNPFITNLGRTFFVQAQVMQKTAQTENWVMGATNTQLESQLLTAVDRIYIDNLVPGQELRNVGVEIKIF
jgi:hypothetical protein